MVRIRRLLLLGHTHHDVGYTNSPRIIDRMHGEIVREVLRLADADDQPLDAPDRFRWTFEVARPVQTFLRTSTPAERESLRRHVAEGTVCVTGGYLNLTQLPDAPEFAAAYRALEEIRALSGKQAQRIPIRTEQHGDVNGIAWGAADAMLDAGIDRLLMALNPDHGRPPLEQPSAFWWEAPSGRRVFTLLSTHYGFGEEWGIVDGDVELACESIQRFVERLDARDDYPFDTAVVHAGNDNRWPTALFVDVVRAWNERHPDRAMATSTTDAAMDALIAQAPDDLPVLRGEWADWWSHGHGSTAREVAVYREARRFAQAAREAFPLARARGEGEPALATVLGYRRGPVRLRDESELARAFDAVDEQLLLFGEHTWGSWETYSKPHSHFSHSHWNAKAGFAYAAWDEARDLAVEALYRLAASGTDARAADGVLVANLTDRPRREPVEAEVGSRRATLIADLPPHGVAVLPVPADLPAGIPGTVAEAGRYRAVVDPVRGGVVSLVDSVTGRELVDPGCPHGLGAVVTEVPATREHPMFENPKNFNPAFSGPEFERTHTRSDETPRVSETDAFTRIEWTGRVAGDDRRAPIEVAHALTLYRDLDVIDLAVRISKPGEFAPESVFVAFPFGIREPEFLLETAGAVFAAESEQLPDTSKDWYSIQHAIGVCGEGGAVLWGSADAPLVQLGGFHTGQWARTLDAPVGHVNSWVMNNLHFTNFQARQEFTGTLHYRFRPVEPDGLREQVRRFGDDLALPVQARAYAGPLGR